jgi:hypothetical protein
LATIPEQLTEDATKTAVANRQHAVPGRNEASISSIRNREATINRSVSARRCAPLRAARRRRSVIHQPRAASHVNEVGIHDELIRCLVIDDGHFGILHFEVHGMLRAVRWKVGASRVSQTRVATRSFVKL